MKGENDVTQEQFNAMMEEYLRQRRAQEPAGVVPDRPESGRRRPPWWPGTERGEKGLGPLPPGRRRCRCSTACQRVKKRAQVTERPGTPFRGRV